MSQETPPTFPAELERFIFELTAEGHPQSMRALVLVSRRVNIWIEPLLYTVLSIYHTQWLSLSEIASRISWHGVSNLINYRPSIFKHVRHVCFVDYHPPDCILKILSACGSTVNLTFLDLMGEPCLLPVLDALPLRRLSACLRRFFHNSGPKIDFSYSLFSQITHLDILDWDDHWPFYSDIAKMPALTHVSLSYHQSIPRDICRGVLGHCKKLKVLVIVPSSRRILKSFSREPRIADLLTDPRFVLVLVTDDLENWEISARGGDDYWAIADTIVEKRRWEDVSPAE